MKPTQPFTARPFARYRSTKEFCIMRRILLIAGVSLLALATATPP